MESHSDVWIIVSLESTQIHQITPKQFILIDRCGYNVPNSRNNFIIYYKWVLQELGERKQDKQEARVLWGGKEKSDEQLGMR